MSRMSWRTAKIMCNHIASSRHISDERARLKQQVCARYGRTRLSLRPTSSSALPQTCREDIQTTRFDRLDVDAVCHWHGINLASQGGLFGAAQQVRAWIALGLSLGHSALETTPQDKILFHNLQMMLQRGVHITSQRLPLPCNCIATRHWTLPQLYATTVRRTRVVIAVRRCVICAVASQTKPSRTWTTGGASITPSSSASAQS